MQSMKLLVLLATLTLSSQFAVGKGRHKNGKKERRVVKLHNETVPDVLKEKFGCRVIGNKPEKRPGFAPYKTVTLDCKDFQLSYAVCEPECVNPVTKVTLSSEQYKALPTGHFVQKKKIRGQKKYKCRIHYHIACKCVKNR